MSEMIWTVALCGLCTFLLRWFPFFRSRQGAQSLNASSALNVWLRGVGPAAISALLVVSLIGVQSAEPIDLHVFRIGVALVCVAVVHRIARGGISLPTLSGALVYGALSQTVF